MSTSRQPMVAPINPYGVIDPVVSLLAEQVAEELKNPTTKAEPKVPVPKTRKYLFRTRPGTVRKLKLRIPAFPDAIRYIDEPQRGKGKYGEDFYRRWEHKYGKQALEAYEDMKQAIGGVYIEFTEVANAHQCYYETDNEAVADFIRSVIATGRQPHLYEETAGQTLRSKYTDALFDDTEQGRQQLYMHDLAYERAVRDIATAQASEPQGTPKDVFSPEDMELITALLQKHRDEQAAAFEAEQGDLVEQMRTVEDVANRPVPDAVTPIEAAVTPAPTRRRSTTSRPPRNKKE